MDVYSWVRRSLSRPGREDSKQRTQEEDEDEILGVTDRLIDFVKTFTVETFKNFPLRDEDGGDCGDGAPASTGNVRKDLSGWQERHATLVLSKVKDMSQLRFRLCPRHLKERQFWRIYFKLVKSYTAEYELHAIQLAKLREMRNSNADISNTSACEVEMSETKQSTGVAPTSSSLEDLNSIT